MTVKIVLTVASLVVVTGVLLYIILKDKKVTKSEMSMFKSWLTFAVAQAEDEFGKDTGKAKLYSVYDKFITKFPALAEIITIEQLSDFVDSVKKSDVCKKIMKHFGVEVE